jgi:hypothetical protein
MAINGVDAGGKMTARIQAGYDQKFQSAPDGLQVPLKDKAVQFVRGTIVTQDWVEAVNLLNGTLGTYVFYERKSGVAEASGYIKHTITAPIIHRMSLRISSGDKNTVYATAEFDFECRPADESKGIIDMWAMTDSQNTPTYISAARGGIRIETALHGALSLYHITNFTFELRLRLVKACNDIDVGYTCVDAELDGLQCTGSISFQDSSITSAKLKAQQLLIATKATLVLTIRQSQGATDKVVTIAGVDINDIAEDASAEAEFTAFSANFDIANNGTTQLTLAGANKIITIADAE